MVSLNEKKWDYKEISILCLAISSILLILVGQGYYCFQNGDFYSGEFFDGKMNGEGCYFLRNGDCSEGIFMNSKFMYDGIPIEPYLPEKEKKALIRKLTLGQKKDDKINELKDIQVVRLP